MKELLLIAIGSALVNNVVLSQFLGLCPFLGVSKNVKTSAGMGAAVIFVITIASFVTSLIYKSVLVGLRKVMVHYIIFSVILTPYIKLFALCSSGATDVFPVFTGQTAISFLKCLGKCPAVRKSMPHGNFPDLMIRSHEFTNCIFDTQVN